MVVADAATGRSLPVTHCLPALHDLLKRRQPHAQVQSIELEGRCVAVRTVDAEHGLDNGFNLLETSTRPLRRSEGGLSALANVVQQGLTPLFEALQADGACVLNASQHPDCARDMQWYRQVCVPRPIYRELVGHRGWRHWEGIDAKAQNGANVQVAAADATRALNVMIGLAAAHVALFANSPLEDGRETGLKESRLTLWPRVFRGSRYAGDAMLAGCPPRPFTDLGDYFRWMFRPGTVSRSLPMGRCHDYKAAPTVLLDDDPSLSAFLAAPSWPGRRTDTGERVELAPESAHFEHSQIAQFMDARLRYRLGTLPPLAQLLHDWRRPHGLEELFEAHGAQIYIEGRCPGAGFVDAVLLAEAGAEVARSMMMSPVALQWGLLQRLDDAERLMARWSWQELRALRDRAMRDALADTEVALLCREVVDIAADALSADEAPMLAYAQYVVDTRRCAADRLLESWQGWSGLEPSQRLAAMVQRHQALPCFYS